MDIDTLLTNRYVTLLMALLAAAELLLNPPSFSVRYNLNIPILISS